MAQAESTRRRRADAERNVAAILDAALGVLAERPGASMSEIAEAAGLARQTIYAHYDSREELLRAVAERAMDETAAAIDASEPGRGPATDALERLIAAWWEGVARHALVLEALATAYPDSAAVHAFHAPVLERLEALVRRGQRSRDFDRDAPAQWLATAFLALMHSTADEVARGRLSADRALTTLSRTIPRLFGARGG